MIATVLIAALLSGLPTSTNVLALPAEPERWTCEIDLSGDAGRLEFERTETGIQGTLAIRGGATGTSPIKGSWGREVIRFTRTLSTGGEESFIGIAVGTEPGRIKMAGRSGVAFGSVWSATCSTGSAQASDAGSGTRPPAPPTSQTPSGSCAITVKASGPRAEMARIYQLLLRGPDSPTAVRGRRPFAGGSVTFPDLPTGRYLVTLDTKADVSIVIEPRQHNVACSAGAMEVVFTFR